MDTSTENIAPAVNEQERLKRLNRYLVLQDTEPAGAFQHVANLAARIFNVPWAFVNFVEADTIRVKACVGVEGIANIDKKFGFCSLAVQREEVSFFENTREEQSLLRNPFVYGELGIQFYAGAPIRTSDGFNLGVVAITDRKPRKFSCEDQQMLLGLAAVVMDELEEWQCLLQSQENPL